MNLCEDPEFFELLTGSYARLVGAPFVPRERGAAWLYQEAPFAVLAHNTDADPRFIYANKAAQDCFGYTWEEFMTLPSRLSAEVAEQPERQRQLAAVTRRPPSPLPR